MTRADRIRQALDSLQAAGKVRSHYSHAPGDIGRRWVIELAGHGWARSYSTRECEAFIMGASA